jgi:hypothetical protein
VSDDVKTERRRAIEEAVKGLNLHGVYREHFIRLLERLESDDDALIVLKGHLVLEERLTAAIEKFVFHPEFIDRARLTFADKIAIGRSMSLDQHESSIWDLIGKLNSLRNKLAHSLDGEARAKATEALREAFKREVTNPSSEELGNDRILLASAISMCLGFVLTFEQEVERFRHYVGAMDRAINPHRHKNAPAVPE